MVRIDNALTGNGNLKTEVHKNIRNQVGQNLIADLLGFEITPNGDYALVVAEADGKPIYARIDLVITMADPFVKRVTKKATAKEEVIVPNLF